GDGPRAAHGEIVHRTVDGELADRPARKFEWADDESICGHRQALSAYLERGRIGQRREQWTAEDRREQAFDETTTGQSAGAVRHLDLSIGEADEACRGRFGRSEG